MPRKLASAILLSALLIVVSSICFAQIGLSPPAPNTPAAAAPAEAKLSFEGGNSVMAATELIADKKYDDAMQSIERAMHSDPKSGIPYMLKGYILDLQHEPKPAEKAFVKALALSPDNGYVLKEYGVHLCDMQQYDLADTYFLKATKDATYSLAHRALEHAAKCAYKNNNLAVAEQRARSALALNPDTAGALEIMAEIKFKQAQFMEARAFIQRREAVGLVSLEFLQMAQQVEKNAGDAHAAAQYQVRIDVLLASEQTQPKGEGQKKP